MNSLLSEASAACDSCQRHGQGDGRERECVRGALRRGAEVDANKHGDADDLADEARRQYQPAQIRGLLGANVVRRAASGLNAHA